MGAYSCTATGVRVLEYRRALPTPSVLCVVRRGNEAWFGGDQRHVVHASRQSLKKACPWAFESTKTAPSATQQQVSETLCRMGLSVEDEVHCPKSGYSIDMLVSSVHSSALEIGGERSSKGGSWAVEFDGPSHFLASGAPTSATLLKRRHLRLLGHTLVSVPYLEWDRCLNPKP